MIETTVLEYLSAEMEGTPCVMEKPDALPDEFILIEKTGGGEADYIYSATLAVQSYARSMLRAAQLNDVVKSAMRDIIRLGDVSKCSLNSDYNFTDLSMKRYRYQAVFDLVYFEGGI